MKSDTYTKRIWMIFSPMFLYLAISFLLSFIYMGVRNDEIMAIAMANSQDSLDAALDAFNTMLNRDGLWLTGIMNIIALPLLFRMYRRDSYRIEEPKVYSKAYQYAILAVLGAASAVAFNFLIAVSGIMDMFADTYQSSAEMLYTAPIWVQIAVSAIIGPATEELIFRGIIYRRMRTYAIVPLAMLVSAIFFGIYHMNILQFIYAAALGLILAYVYEKFHSLVACTIVHGSGNAISVLLSNNSGVEALLSGNDDRIIVTTIISGMITVACVIYLLKMKNDNSALVEEMYKEV